ncbi:MAG: HD domain-containing protein [Candidatus Shapirobacteria bacterium]|nr:HD domain-containing protein [Candidatus Shapirobacteria bacterium]
MKQSDIYKLHKKYSTNEKILEIGWNHSLIIRDISLQIADNLEKKYGIKTNKKLIEIGALIHDIGFYQYLDDVYKKKHINNYIHHGESGYKLLINIGIPKNKSRFALTHVGVGVGKNVPITLEEEIVCYADIFHSKGRPRLRNFNDSLKGLVKINPDYGVILKRYKEKFGIPNLKQLKKQYKKWHKEINKWVENYKATN